MKIAIAQQNYSIGDFGKNATKISKAIFEAKQKNADLIVFPEMCICGSFPFDLLQKEDFIETTMQVLQRIATESFGIAVLLGCPTYSEDENETKLYNSAIFIENGVLTRRFNKKNLSHLETKYFISDTEKNVFEWKNKKIAVCVGNDKPEKEDGISLAINIAAKSFKHKECQCNNIAKNSFPTIYVSQFGGNTEVLYEGHSSVYNADGEKIIELPYFEEGFEIYDTEKTYEPIKTSAPSEIQLLHDALVLGLKDYFEKNNFKTATLGLSGGIDSAVVLSLAAEAIGSENIRVLLLPSEFSTSHSITDAEGLAKNLGVQYDIVPIKSIYTESLSSLSPLFQNLPFSLAEENLQARIRGILLMAVSNKFGNILLNTSNKSEVAVGYGTLYGDTNGSISVLGDVYKTDVFNLARYINRDKEIIPINTILKPPSAELHPDQKDSDSLPDYDTLDKILYQYVECGKSENAIVEMGFSKETVAKTISLLKRCEYKRKQCCPAIRVSQKPFAETAIPLIAKF
ncbi:MAG: NAD+ synthase [Bacteroidales bacterium]|nr:NAD+ synthase [Bacteroidales bacterium]